MLIRICKRKLTGSDIIFYDEFVEHIKSPAYSQKDFSRDGISTVAPSVTSNASTCSDEDGHHGKANLIPGLMGNSYFGNGLMNWMNKNSDGKQGRDTQQGTLARCSSHKSDNSTPKELLKNGRESNGSLLARSKSCNAERASSKEGAHPGQNTTNSKKRHPSNNSSRKSTQLSAALQNSAALNAHASYQNYTGTPQHATHHTTGSDNGRSDYGRDTISNANSANSLSNNTQGPNTLNNNHHGATTTAAAVVVAP